MVSSGVELGSGAAVVVLAADDVDVDGAVDVDVEGELSLVDEQATSASETVASSVRRRT
jgi:hypothetical protein